MLKRTTALLLVFAALSGAFAACGENAGIPETLSFRQITTARDYVRKDQYVICTYPETANAKVNGEMKALIDEMAQRGRSYLPKGKIDLMPSYLDVGAQVFRTGKKWMSFLTIARIAYEREQVYVDYDARTYDMETGSRLKLTDLFSADSPAWEMMEQAAREQLSDYFATEQPDPKKLDALCAREALENASFTLTPAKIELHYRADALYSGKTTLMHVKLYDSVYRPLMTALGQEITDNSMYKMIALTYDDGGARGATNNVLDKLRLHGANATFFIVGTMMGNNHDVMSRQQDAGCALASHNYEHTYENLTQENILRWKEKFNQRMDEIVGVRPAYMRAPGGHFQAFINAEVGLPLIQWSIISTDAGSDQVAKIVATVKGNAKDGSVVLMHDINPKAYQYTDEILTDLENRGFLCVTVDELFDLYGVPLLENQVYYSCEEEAARK